jgi:hypothetical protein
MDFVIFIGIYAGRMLVLLFHQCVSDRGGSCWSTALVGLFGAQPVLGKALVYLW